MDIIKELLKLFFKKYGLVIIGILFGIFFLILVIIGGIVAMMSSDNKNSGTILGKSKLSPEVMQYEEQIKEALKLLLK